MEELVHSFWGADISLQVDRAKQTIDAVDQALPQATFWKAIHQHQHGPEARFEAKSDSVIAEHGGTLTALWNHSVAHLASHNLDPNDLVVNASAYSPEIDLSVRIYMDDSALQIEVEPEKLQTALTQYQDQILALVRDIGARPAISGCWLRKQAAFAGDPVCLYEKPKNVFANLSNPLRYKKVADDVRKVRESVRGAVSPSNWKRLLRDAGAQVETISADRLFVELGDPKGEGGALVLRQLEKEVERRLGK